MNKSNEQISYEAGKFIANMLEVSHGQLTENQGSTAIATWGKNAASLDLTEDQVTAFQAGMDAWFTRENK